eukprot:8294611-Alexandrium_andersonii.AAC.1
MLLRGVGSRGRTGEPLNPSTEETPTAKPDQMLLIDEVDARILAEAFKAPPLPAGHHAISINAKKAARERVKTPQKTKQQHVRAAKSEEWWSASIIQTKCTTARNPPRSYVQGKVNHPAVSGQWKLIAEISEKRHPEHRALIDRLAETIVKKGMSKAETLQLLQDCFWV